MVIKAVHTLLYSTDPPATRAFLRDVLGWPFVVDPDSAPDWLIFRTGPSELGVHPSNGSDEGRNPSPNQHHSVSLICDDLDATRAELERKGATFSTDIEDVGFGMATTLDLPGAGGILLYEPRHPEAHGLPEPS